MHELSIAAAIVESVLEFAATHGHVVEVRLRVGELTCVQDEQLRFCYESVTKTTPIEDSRLAIEHVAAVVTCAHCGFSGSPKYWDEIPTLQCPGCGQSAEASEGHECAIHSIKFVA